MNKSLRNKLYFDCEFSGLHKNTELISFSAVDTYGNTFVFTRSNIDFDEDTLHKSDEDFIKNTIIPNTTTDYDKDNPLFGDCGYSRLILQERVIIVCDQRYEAEDITNYRERFREAFGDFIEKISKYHEPSEKFVMVGDVCGYDWVLFCDMFGHAFNIPKEIYYIPIDISTMMYSNEVIRDSDYSRKELFNRITLDRFHSITEVEHNSLSDAIIIYTLFKYLNDSLHN